MWGCWRRIRPREGRDVLDARRAPGGLVELVGALDVHERARAMPEHDSIVDAKAWRERRGEEEATVGRPLANARVRRVDGRDLGERAAVEDVDLAREIAKADKRDQATLRVEGDVVLRSGAEVMQRAHTLVEEHSLGGHVYEHVSAKY